MGERRVSEAERMRRWRLVLGGADEAGGAVQLGRDDLRIDVALGSLYDAPRPLRSGAS